MLENLRRAVCSRVSVPFNRDYSRTHTPRFIRSQCNIYYVLVCVTLFYTNADATALTNWAISFKFGRQIRRRCCTMKVVKMLFVRFVVWVTDVSAAKQ